MTTPATDVLNKRARSLAAPRRELADALATTKMEILIFVIGDERLALPLASIVAITRATHVAPLPRAVAPVYGVIAWRGRPLTVLALGRTELTDSSDHRLIVLGDERRARVGLLADSIEDTEVVDRSSLSEPQQGARRAMALGVTDSAILVLDADAMLNTTRSGS